MMHTLVLVVPVRGLRIAGLAPSFEAYITVTKEWEAPATNRRYTGHDPDRDEDT